MNEVGEMKEENEYDINIEGLCKGAVLAALYNNTRPVGMGMLNPRCYDFMTEEEGLKHIEERVYFDYLQGRPIKIDFSNDSIYVRNYDRDCGAIKAKTIIEKLRASKG